MVSGIVVVESYILLTCVVVTVAGDPVISGIVVELFSLQACVVGAAGDTEASESDVIVEILSSGVVLVCVVVAVVNGGAVETSGHVSAFSSHAWYYNSVIL